MEEVLFHFSLLAYFLLSVYTTINHVITLPLVNKNHLLMVQLLSE